MSFLEAAGRLLRRWFTSIPFFVLLSVALGVAVAVPVVPEPKIATIPLSGIITDQSFTDDILDTIKTAREDRNVRAVVLMVDSPGGYVVSTEAIYLEMLKLRSQKPVVASINMIGASGGYHIAVAAEYIYALPTSEVGSIGAFSSLPSPERLDEITLTTGLFKATGGSARKALTDLEIIRQEFISVVRSHRGDRLKLSDQELSEGKLYLGIESLRYGLIDEIGTTADAIDKAASLAGLKNYGVTEYSISQPFFPFFFFGSANLTALKAQSALAPVYYYLHFESE